MPVDYVRRSVCSAPIERSGVRGSGVGSAVLGKTGATATTPAAGTQSVNSVLFGAHPQAPAHPAATPTPKPSASGGSSATDVTVPDNARYGIPCVY